MSKLWDTTNAMVRMKVIYLNAYIKKEERPQTHNLNLHLKNFEKEQINPKASRQKEIIKIIEEINEIVKRKTIEKTSIKLRVALKKINKTDEPLVNYKRKREDSNY